MAKVKIEILEDLNPSLTKGMVIEATQQPASGLVASGKAKYFIEPTKSKTKAK